MGTLNVTRKMVLLPMANHGLRGHILLGVDNSANECMGMAIEKNASTVVIPWLLVI